MRLIKNIERLEASAATRAEASALPVGLVWSRNERLVDPLSLMPGEYIACDVRILETADFSALEVLEGVPPLEPPAWWAISERITRDAADLGAVMDWAGAVLGRVVLIDGSLLRWEAFAAEEPAAAAVAS